MESPEQLQHRMESFDELRSIVRTMKALAAVSIRQYEKAAQSLVDYYRTVELGLHVVLRDLRGEPPAPAKHHGGRLAAIVFGSDQGLCGRFNEEIVDHARKRIHSAPPPADHVTTLSVGMRTAAYLEQLGQPPEESFLVPGSAQRITATVQQILLKLEEWRTQFDVDYVYLFYNRHVSGSGYRPTGIQLLPVNLARFRNLEERQWPSRRVPTFTMNREQLLAGLLRQYFFVSLFRACAESLASEHGARLAAMQSAEKNLDDRLDEILAEYRRVRQDSITAELLDVVSGFEALTGGE